MWAWEVSTEDVWLPWSWTCRQLWAIDEGAEIWSSARATIAFWPLWHLFSFFWELNRGSQLVQFPFEKSANNALCSCSCPHLWLSTWSFISPYFTPGVPLKTKRPSEVGPYCLTLIVNSPLLLERRWLHMCLSGLCFFLLLLFSGFCYKHWMRWYDTRK